MKPGDTFELKLTPAADVTTRYAEASGDFNSIHIDDRVARSMGFPGRILHGLWTMAQVARLHTDAAGSPEALKRLEVKFRAIGVPGEELKVTSTVRSLAGGVAVLDCEARQAGRRVVRGGVAELEVR